MSINNAMPFFLQQTKNTTLKTKQNTYNEMKNIQNQIGFFHFLFFFIFDGWLNTEINSLNNFQIHLSSQHRCRFAVTTTKPTTTVRVPALQCNVASTERLVDSSIMRHQMWIELLVRNRWVDCTRVLLLMLMELVLMSAVSNQTMFASTNHVCWPAIDRKSCP